MKRSSRFALLVSCVSMFLFTSSALWAVDVSVNVTYEVEAGCVTEINLSVEEEYRGKCGSDSKTVCFDTALHVGRRILGQHSEVTWSLNPADGSPPGTTWSIRNVAARSNYSICPPEIFFNNEGEASCKAQSPVAFSSDWEYGVLARKTGCEPAVLDPAVIFRTGRGGGLIPIVAALVALLALFGGGFYLLWWRPSRRRRSAR